MDAFAKRLRYAAAVVALAALYVAVARVGLTLDSVSRFAALVWAPTGISLAALLIWGPGLWPGVALGALAANFLTGAPIAVAAGIALGNTLEAVVAFYALRRLGFSRTLERTRDVILLVVVGAVLSTTLSATLGVLSLAMGHLLPWADAHATWTAWWLGDAIGDILVAPLILTWSVRSRTSLDRKRLLEALLLALTLGALGFSIFFWRGPAVRRPAWLQPHLLFPVLIWAALRFKQRGSSTATFSASVLAIASTMLGTSPFVRETLHQQLEALQLFMSTVGITMLVLGAAICERIRATEMREELLAIVSHDLRNPLSAILMSAQYMQRKGRSPTDTDKAKPEHHKQLDIIARSVRRMEGLIRDLLDWSALKSGRIPLELRVHDAMNLVNDAADLMEPLAREKSQVLRIEGMEEPLGILCDRNRILQVFSNLIGNAIKFTPENGSILVRSQPLGNQICFSIADTGPGIGDDPLPNLFDRYWQGNPAYTSGLGLGLSIAKGIVDAHGGRIWAENSAAGGSTFSFTIFLAGARLEKTSADPEGPHLSRRARRQWHLPS